jgi:hypothetical protein
MNYLILLFLLAPSFSHASLSVISRESRYQDSPPPKIKSTKLQNKNPEIKALIESNEKINRLLSQRLSKPHIMDLTASFDFPTGTILKGKLLNSILSTNLISPLIVEIKEGELKGAKIHCQGLTLNKRIHTNCPTIIFNDKEYSASTTLLNPDGTAGLLGSYYEGHDELLAANGAQNLIQGLSTLGQNTIASPLKSKFFEAGTNTLSSSSDLLKNESKENSGVVLIKGGTSVLLFFNQGFKQ